MGAHLPAGAAAISPTDSPHAAAATEASPSTSAAPHGGGGGGGGGAKLGGSGLKQRRPARSSGPHPGCRRSRHLFETY